MKSRARHGLPPIDPIKDATIAALNLIMEPLCELMLDAGVTVHELNKLIRERTVHVAMRRLMAAGNRKSKSRAAIITGLPRSEIANILRSTGSAAPAKPVQLPAKRIIAAWNDDPRFSGANGNPAVLPIFGRVASFEQLVNRYGGGIPVRAMLDELTHMQAIEQLPDQKVKIQLPNPAIAGLTSLSIAVLGQRSSDLLKTLAHNRRQPAAQLFEGTVVGTTSDRDAISSVRQELTAQGTALMNAATALLTRTKFKKNSKISEASEKYRVGVTIFYFEDTTGIQSEPASAAKQSRRKNLRRHSRSAPSSKVAASKA